MQAVGCHYFPPGGCYQFCCLVNRGTMGVNSLPKTVTRQADLQRIGISSGTLRSVMEYGLVLPFALLRSPTPAPACQLVNHTTLCKRVQFLVRSRCRLRRVLQWARGTCIKGGGSDWRQLKNSIERSGNTVLRRLFNHLFCTTYV